MVIVALVIAWIVSAAVLAVLIGRSLAVAGKSDRWRHGHREVRDLRHLHPVPSVPLAERTAA